MKKYRSLKIKAFASAAIALFLLPISVFCEESDGFFLESGKPIPGGGRYAPLARGLASDPAGIASIGKIKNALIIRTQGFAHNAGVFAFKPDGKARDGAPIYKEAITLKYADETLNKEKRASGLKIFSLSDGNVYSFNVIKWKLYRAKYNPETGVFENIAKPTPFDAKVFDVAENPDGTLTIFATQSNGDKLSPKGVGHRHPDYTPFDGAGIWKGKLPYDYISATVIESVDSENIPELKRVSKTKNEILLGAKNISHFKSEDGQIRLIVSGRLGNFAYYRVGEDGALSEKKYVKTEDGITLRNSCILASAVISPDAEGNPDMIVGSEGPYHYYEVASYEPDGAPIYKKARHVRERGGNLYAGSLPVVNAVDWDGDGLCDIVAGNSQGEIWFFKNSGEEGKPKFEEGRPLKMNGETFSEKGGYWAIQGPGESPWGYVSPTAFDWNEDGLLDIVSSDSSARFGVYINAGTKDSENLKPRKLLLCDGLEVHGTWRVRPAAAKLPNGKIAYVNLDDDDAFHLYWKIDDLNVADGGKLLLSDGNKITANFLPVGATGRAKIVLKDVDGDGNYDLLVGTPRHGSIPEPKNGIPQSFGLPGAAVVFLRNAGDNEHFSFEKPKMMTLKSDLEAGRKTVFGQHECSADIADFGNGLRGIIVGTEEGRILFFREGDFVWE